jgi:phytoene dehydrogenase-like protein
MTANHYDIIIIGGGHNGLTAAAYLAKGRKRVLVLERRAIIGGSAVTEDFGDGFRADAVWTGGTLRPEISRHLQLSKFGWMPSTERPLFTSLLGDSENLRLVDDPIQASEAIKRFSEKDAARWPEFVAFMNKAAMFLDGAYSTVMPRLPREFGLVEAYGLAELGLDLRLMGRKDMLHLIRMLPMTAAEFLEEWFESEPLKAALASVGIHGVTLGVMSAGTGYTLLHNWLNRGGLAHRNVGKTGEITRWLAQAVTSGGGEIRTLAEVAQILVDTYTCRGVALAGGEEIRASTVVSAVDPKRTFLSLVGSMNLPPEFVWKTQSIRMRGSVAKVHLLTNGDHGIPPGTCVLAPSLNYLERAYDAAKYGEISASPYLEVTTHDNVVSIHFQFAPYELKQSNWIGRRTDLERLAIGALAEHFPNLQGSTLGRKTITPLDLEETYGLTEGDLNHGQLALDQFLFMRPIPGWANHRTPVDGLHLCGSGVHGGGGISGAPGRNVVRSLLGSPRRQEDP